MTEAQFVLAPKLTTPSDQAKAISRHISAAKGANVAGLQILFQNYGVSSMILSFSISPAVLAASQYSIREAHRLIPNISRFQNPSSRQHLHRRRLHRPALVNETRRVVAARPSRSRMPLRNSIRGSSIISSNGCQFNPAESSAPGESKRYLTCFLHRNTPRLNVQEADICGSSVSLRAQLDERSRELADWRADGTRKMVVPGFSPAAPAGSKSSNHTISLGDHEFFFSERLNFPIPRCQSA